MKLVTAILNPSRLDEVFTALKKLEVQGITVTEVRGVGRQKGHMAFYSGAEYLVTLLPKLKIEVAVTEAVVENVIAAIRSVGDTNRIGHGKILVHSLQDARRVRTGEAGEAAL